MDEEIQTNVRDKLKPYYAMASVAECLPALGIVAAVLGVIKSDGARSTRPGLARPSDRRGAGRNLCRHFSLLWRGFRRSPTRIKVVREKKCRLFVVIKQTLLAFMNGAMPQIALEHGRQDDLRARPADQSTKSSTRPSQAERPSPAARRRRNRWRPDMARHSGSTVTLRSCGFFEQGRVSRPRAIRACRRCSSACSWRNVEALRESVSPRRRNMSSKDIQAEPLASSRRGQRRRHRAIFSVPEWQSRVVFTIDRPFVYAIKELAFGGDGSEPPYSEARRFSQIEKRMSRAPC